MNILAFDTSTEWCSAVLWRDGEMIAREALAGQAHSQRLLVMVDEVLSEGGVRVADLHGVAYGEGPGSFTGLRIACGIAQGLAFAHGIKVLGINTLLALAEGSGAPRALCCVDARMQEIYCAAFESIDGQWRTVHPAIVCPPARVPDLPGGGWHGCGSAFGVYRDVLEARYGAQLAAMDATAWPRAHSVARLAAPRFAAGEGADAASAVPVYVRDKVAYTTDERAAR